MSCCFLVAHIGTEPNPPPDGEPRVSSCCAAFASDGGQTRVDLTIPQLGRPGGRQDPTVRCPGPGGPPAASKPAGWRKTFANCRLTGHKPTGATDCLWRMGPVAPNYGSPTPEKR